MLIAMIISAAFSSFVFLVSEKNHLGRLYGILPLRKSELVLGRYLYTLLFGLANAVAASLLTFIISIVTGKTLAFLDLSAYVCVSFLYFCLFASIVFPVYFRFGFSKNYLLTNVPLYVLYAVGFGQVRKGNLKGLYDVMRYFTREPRNDLAMRSRGRAGTPGGVLWSISLDLSKVRAMSLRRPFLVGDARHGR